MRPGLPRERRPLAGERLKVDHRIPRERGPVFADKLLFQPLSFLQHSQFRIRLSQSQSDGMSQSGKDLHAELRMRP